MSVKQTFWQLLGNYQIEIPIIQRDYAQGRVDSKAEQIRVGFVQSLHHTVIDTDKSQDLDFIYGSVHHDVLTLLDGQQRLTTLFLLHWYIATGTDSLDNAVDKLGRFSYKTRVSSREFVNSLLSFGRDIDIYQCEGDLSEAIIDAHWFFSVWRNDPTVQSMLTMLDEIHRVFRTDLANGKSLWEKLISEGKPPVTFHFLEMKEFALTDELYIKMNARGRPLTEFENFKAWLQSYVDHQPHIELNENFWELMDKDWTDVFWKLRHKGEYEVDNLFLSYFKSIALINSALQLDASQKRLEGPDDSWVIACRDNTFIPTQYYEDRLCFEAQTLNQLGALLSLVHQLQNAPIESKAASVWEQCRSLFEGILSRRSHQEQARFSAFYLFVRKSCERKATSENWSDEQLNELSDWLSVTSRLSLNIAYDITMDFVNSTHVLNSLIERVDITNVLASLAQLDSSDMRFFNENQRSEEILKAQLICEDPNWRERFVQYEKHDYFYYQIGFLIKGAQLADGRYDPQRFELLASKAAVLFGKELLETSDFLLQRALLSVGQYLVKPSHSNHSFCRSVTGNARYRYENWRRLFNNEERCNILFELLDKLEQGSEKQGLQDIVDNANCGDWRQYFILYPEAICYSSKRQIRLGYESNDEVYLLNGQRMSGRYAGLRTYALYQELLKCGAEFEGAIEYSEAVGDQNSPAVVIRAWQNASLHIEYLNGQFDYCLLDEENERLEVELEQSVNLLKLRSIADSILHIVS